MYRHIACGANSLKPDDLKPLERRAEMCRILAVGLIRLHARQSSELSAEIGECSLHIQSDWSGTANANHRRTA
ncbi:hypothetical protein SAMN04488003_1233 [Loktanella fryxellensis]|uniref:Uncharacterized protein n=1 Tax=Loktanella fryxellensis TaxID=245187 RepID=A0A1H8I0J5_9RHOB|nr:hypothetical protein SAMN04488003_1233 [Loktanella fryxellensis]